MSRVPAARAAPGAGWGRAAERFYDREALLKALPARHRLFAESYRAVGARLSLGPGSIILDAGCGCGELASALTGSGLRVVGLDLSRVSLRTALAFHPGRPFLLGDLAEMPFADGAFDGAAAVTSVEFCPDRGAALAELARVLKPGGRLYLDVRNQDFILFRWLSRLRVMLPLLRKAGLLEPYPAEGFRDLAGKEWEDLAARQGFRLVARHPSAWPWNFGGPMTRGKNLLIALCKRLAPVRNQYMIGYVFEKGAGPANPPPWRA